jgi:hypothetical protein
LDHSHPLLHQLKKLNALKYLSAVKALPTLAPHGAGPSPCAAVVPLAVYPDSSILSKLLVLLFFQLESAFCPAGSATCTLHHRHWVCTPKGMSVCLPLVTYHLRPAAPPQHMEKATSRKSEVVDSRNELGRDEGEQF